MSKSYYECHITMLGDPKKVEPLVKSLKWKFSAIDGDPTLGDGIKLYATRHYNSRMEQGRVLDELLITATKLEEFGIEVIRRKIELVIYDDRSSTVSFKCKGGCPECHLDDLPGQMRG